MLKQGAPGPTDTMGFGDARQDREYSPERRLSRRRNEEPEDPGWKVREAQFHQQQIIQRVQMHIRDQRPTLFDRLVVNTIVTGYISSSSPAELVRKADEAEWHKTDESISALLEHETQPPLLAYWRAIQIYSKTIKKTSRDQAGRSLAVLADIHDMLEKKTHEELCKLEVHVRGKLKCPDADPDYWGSLLEELQLFKAKSSLEDQNKRLLRTRRDEAQLKGQVLIDIDSMETLTARPVNIDSEILPNWDDSVEATRLLVLYSKIAIKGNEMLFNDDLPHSTEYPWAHALKVVPLKPRFFNWCYTRIEWTKYNQAHFNSDHPPPPTIQGFSFNIFYPLSNPSGGLRNPTYRSEPDTLDPENFQLVRFIGGPPYQDLLFRIPAKQWELGHKHGFRCTFENSTLSLSFRFKRLYYRR